MSDEHEALGGEATELDRMSEEIGPEQMDVHQGEAASEPTVSERPTHSTIHTVLDFYEHVSNAASFTGFAFVRFRSLFLIWQLQASLFIHQPKTLLTIAEANGIQGAKKGSRDLWMRLQHLTQPLAAELTETLRMILEPTRTSKLEFDIFFDQSDCIIRGR